ncbi:MAG: hypothetical protein HUU47_03350 [Bacteroidetes bacterium]|nr:hypothetical protein [Bacteroidota bacterium]
MKTNYIFILILLSLFLGCRYDNFDTEINVKLISGIKYLKVNPCKVVIYHTKTEWGEPSGYAPIDTITTDSFGNGSKFVKLFKLKKNEYFAAVLLESKWQFPWDNERRVIPEIKNTFGYGIYPKWRRTITLEDSSGKYQMDTYEYYHSLSTNNREYIHYDSLKKFNQQFLYQSAPSYSHIFITLYLHSRNTKEKKIFKYIFDANKYYDIWIKY